MPSPSTSLQCGKKFYACVPHGDFRTAPPARMTRAPRPTARMASWLARFPPKPDARVARSVGWWGCIEIITEGHVDGYWAVLYGSRRAARTHRIFFLQCRPPYITNCSVFSIPHRQRSGKISWFSVVHGIAHSTYTVAQESTQFFFFRRWRKLINLWTNGTNLFYW